MAPTVLLLYGGESVEHDVSVASARHVSQHLKGEILPVGITRDGSWYLQKSVQSTIEVSREVSLVPKRGIFFQGNRIEADLVFPMLHGSYGEDGTVQGLLSFLPYPTVSSSLLSSSVGISKHLSKQLCLSLGIPVTSYRFFLEGEPIEPGILPPFPLFVKPDRCGSSIGITPVKNFGEMKEAAEHAFTYDNRIVVEQAADGFELQCAWIYSRKELWISPLGEIHVEGGFHSYQTKYRETTKLSHIIPSTIDESLGQIIYGFTRRLLRQLSFPLYGRIDFFFDPRQRKLYFNELNTIPGMTPSSMFPKLCEAGGIAFSQALDMIMDGSIELHQADRKLTYHYYPGDTDET